MFSLFLFDTPTSTFIGVLLRGRVILDWVFRENLSGENSYVIIIIYFMLYEHFIFITKKNIYNKIEATFMIIIKMNVN